MFVFIDDMPRLKEQANTNISAMQKSISNRFGVSEWKQDQWLRASIGGLFERGSEFLQTVFAATTGTIVKFLLVPVYVFFMLYYRNKFERFFVRILNPFHRYFNPKQLIGEISTIIKNYMIGVSTVVLILIFLNSIGLLIVGIEYAIMLGIISALFNFIPYFGTLIGGAIPLLFALLTGPSPATAIGVLILFLIIQFTENNILTPNISGGFVRINPFMTILSIILGGMIWGLPGMFLVVPFMGIVRVVCSYVPVLAPVDYLLSTKGTAKHALTWPKIKDFFNYIANNKPKQKKK
jgi:predicted PurR-regulated permease PerM